MEEQEFDWIKYVSDTFKLGLPWAALFFIIIIILLKFFEKLLDKKLDKFGSKYEKKLEFINVLKEKATDNCRQIIKTIPRIRDLISGKTLDEKQITKVLEQVNIFEDELRSLRIIISDNDKDYITLHNWKNKLLNLLATWMIDKPEECSQKIDSIIENYESVNESINNIVKKITD